MPILIFVIAYVFTAYAWGYTEVRTFEELNKHIYTPDVMIRELFLLYYVYQLLYLIRIFNYHSSVYEKDIDNYFADSSHLQLLGVKRSFYSALIVGIFAFISCFILSPLLMVIFDASYSLFYLVFALYYIQYPRKFIYIEPAIYPANSSAEKYVYNKKRLVWADFKDQIIADKYYLKSGVTIEDMAQYLKIGRTTLSTFINNHEGMNFNLWINSLRVEEAKNLLIDYPHYNLTQIAELIGYSEPSNFSRHFKLITKESPSVWRQTCQQESENYKLN
jgi:AraC-like DNA-binding protein